MHSLDEIMNMSPEEFTKNWNDGSIQDSALKIIGAREMTEDEKEQLKDTEK